MHDFVDRRSIVRKIWGHSDLILLIFAGSAAEFALNRAVDWLFFTNKLPSDPVGRLFSTVRHAQQIVFVDEATAERTFQRIIAAHKNVERARGGNPIPDWAHRDVLYMLVDYTRRAYELLQRPLTNAERVELYAVFKRVGEGLQIPKLPSTYADWQVDRERHMERDLAFSPHTARLFKQYRRHLGAWRYDLLLQVQSLLVPPRVGQLLRLKPLPLLPLAVQTYRLFDQLQLRSLVQLALIPPNYLKDVRAFDRNEA